MAVLGGLLKDRRAGQAGLAWNAPNLALYRTPPHRATCWQPPETFSPAALSTASTNAPELVVYGPDDHRDHKRQA